jgi:hypothetical protein
MSAQSPAGGDPPTLGTSRSTAPRPLPGHRRKASGGSIPLREMPRSQRVIRARRVPAARRIPAARRTPAAPRTPGSRLIPRSQWTSRSRWMPSARRMPWTPRMSWARRTPWARPMIPGVSAWALAAGRILQRSRPSIVRRPRWRRCRRSGLSRRPRRPCDPATYPARSRAASLIALPTGRRSDLGVLRPTRARWNTATSTSRHLRPASLPLTPRTAAACRATSTRPLTGPPNDPHRLLRPRVATWARRPHRLDMANARDRLQRLTGTWTRLGGGLRGGLRSWTLGRTCGGMWMLRFSGLGRRRRSGGRWRSRGPRSRFGGLSRDLRCGGGAPATGVTVRMAGPGGGSRGRPQRRRLLRGGDGGGSGSWRWC